jgi:hypothetical protein
MSPEDYELEEAQRRLYWKRRQIEQERPNPPCNQVADTVWRVLAHAQRNEADRA